MSVDKQKPSQLTREVNPKQKQKNAFKGRLARFFSR